MEGLPVGHVVAVGAAALSERTRRARPRMVKNQPVAHDGNRGHPLGVPLLHPLFLDPLPPLMWTSYLEAPKAY